MTKDEIVEYMESEIRTLQRMPLRPLRFGIPMPEGGVPGEYREDIALHFCRQGLSVRFEDLIWVENRKAGARI